MITALHHLRHRLPGEPAWASMRPVMRRRNYTPVPRERARQGAVLVLLIHHGGTLRVPLIRRTADHGPHSRQAAFPGGAQEPGDGDLISTACREAHEEIGVPPESYTVAGTLTPLYIDVSGFLVTPVVGWTDAMPDLRHINRREVDQVTLVDLETLPSTRRECTVTVHGPDTAQSEKLEVPAYRTGDLVVWGATAMILAELLAVLHNQQEPEQV